MRIGLVVDGEAEFQSLPGLLRSLDPETGNTTIGTALAKIQPTATSQVIARDCSKHIANLQAKRVDKVVILMDRESRAECPGELARTIRGEIERMSQPSCQVEVVIKNTRFENWLVADLEAVRALPQRFSVRLTNEHRIVPNKADNVDAMEILKVSASAAGADYHKVQDGRRIVERANPLRIAVNSRSFRRFLRCVDHPLYREQSRRPEPSST